MKGTYLLLIEITKDQNIQIGKLGNLFFKKGFYVYIGSALNNLEKRIQRHLKVDKNHHWHIDYLLDYSKIKEVYYKESNMKKECNIVKHFSKLATINSYGCSDCKCKSHLLYGLNKDIKDIILKIALKKYNR